MSLFKDWGPDDPHPLMYKQMSTSQLSQIAFLFGGVGDGRIQLYYIPIHLIKRMSFLQRVTSTAR